MAHPSLDLLATRLIVLELQVFDKASMLDDVWSKVKKNKTSIMNYDD